MSTTNLQDQTISISLPTNGGHPFEIAVSVARMFDDPNRWFIVGKDGLVFTISKSSSSPSPIHFLGALPVNYEPIEFVARALMCVAIGFPGGRVSIFRYKHLFWTLGKPDFHLEAKFDFVDTIKSMEWIDPHHEEPGLKVVTASGVYEISEYYGAWKKYWKCGPYVDPSLLKNLRA